MIDIVISMRVVIRVPIILVTSERVHMTSYDCI